MDKTLQNRDKTGYSPSSESSTQGTAGFCQSVVQRPAVSATTATLKFSLTQFNVATVAMLICLFSLLARQTCDTVSAKLPRAGSTRRKTPMTCCRDGCLGCAQQTTHAALSRIEESRRQKSGS